MNSIPTELINQHINIIIISLIKIIIIIIVIIIIIIIIIIIESVKQYLKKCKNFKILLTKKSNKLKFEFMKIALVRQWIFMIDYNIFYRVEERYLIKAIAILCPTIK